MKWAVYGRRFSSYGWKLCCATLLLLLFFLTWYFLYHYIPDLLYQQEKNLRSTLDLAVMDTAEVVAVRQGHQLERGQKITPEDMESFVLRSIPEKFLPEVYLSSLKQLSGKVVTDSLVGGEVVKPSSLVLPEDRMEGYYRLVQVPVIDFMLDTLTAGRYIDLLAEDGKGGYIVLVSKVPVHNTGLDDQNQPQVLIPVDEKEQQRIWRALYSGNGRPFIGRIYMTPDQPPSTVDQPTVEENIQGTGKKASGQGDAE